MTEKLSGKLKYLFLILLVLYPLRRIWIGVDLWDGGYNYANFRYPGVEHMDPMWYFATWIATEAGALLTRLPFADTMLVLNFYTGLIVSLLAAAGFFFSVNVLKLPAWIAFLAEVTACGLCWAPSSVLYDYLTFLLLAAGTVLLYRGLVEGKNLWLAAAGAAFGVNVGVRFSNLAQMGLFLAVWAYCLFKKEKLSEVCRKTAFCVAGYAAALGAFVLLMGVLYGFGAYFGGVGRLFSMTEVAQDYAPTGMLTSALKVYFGESSRYWIKRFALALAAGTGICLILPGRAPRVKKLLCVCVTGALFVWLLTHLFVYPDFATYESIYAPCVMLLLFSLAVSLVFLASARATAEQKLLAVIEILLILLTSLGGNNVVYYNINNMFLTLPILAYFLKKLWADREKMALYALKMVATALALLVCALAFRFGNTFSYEEATGGRKMDRVVTGVPVLRGMRTEAERAAQLEELYAFLRDEGLNGRSCILYGEIPGVSYYMELEPAMNIWADLRSYTPDVMEADLGRLGSALKEGKDSPLVILEAGWAEYMERPGEEAVSWDPTALQKLALLKDFMEENHYRRVFENPKFVLYEKKQ